jgi:hypothetical protein
MNYVNYDQFLPGKGHEGDRELPAAQLDHAGGDSGSMARQVATMFGRCLPIPDTPELSYLRCFVTLAFEEATTIANRSAPSAADLDYLARIVREAKAFTSSCA